MLFQGGEGKEQIYDAAGMQEVVQWFYSNARGVVEQLPLPLALTSAAAEWPRLVIVWGTFTCQYDPD